MKRSLLGMRETLVGVGQGRDRRYNIGDRKARTWIEGGPNGGFSLEDEKSSLERETGLSALLMSLGAQGTALLVTEFLHFHFHFLLFEPTSSFRRTLEGRIGLRGLGESTMTGLYLGASGCFILVTSGPLIIQSHDHNSISIYVVKCHLDRRPPKSSQARRKSEAS